MQSHDYRIWFESFAPPAPPKPTRNTSLLVAHANTSACALCLALALTIAPAVGGETDPAPDVCPVHADPLKPCDDDTSNAGPSPTTEDPAPQEISDPVSEPTDPDNSAVDPEPEVIEDPDLSPDTGPETITDPVPDNSGNSTAEPITDNGAGGNNTEDNADEPVTETVVEPAPIAEPVTDNTDDDTQTQVQKPSGETSSTSKPGDDPSASRPEAEPPRADHTVNEQSSGEKVYSAAFFSGKVEHRLPDVPPLTAPGFDELAEYADGGGDPYLVLAMHWDEDGFTSWEKTMQTLPLDLADDKTREEYLVSQGLTALDAENTLRLRSLAEAITLPGLRHGLGNEKIQDKLIQTTLDNPDIVIYEGGREDVKKGYIDPRVLVSLRYLQLRYQQVEISSLHSGHSTYTSGGNISLHSLGQAVDIARLKDVRIQRSTQGEGSLVQQAVKDLAALPEGMGVSEVISLWNLGMPSFALQDHDDHIHLGYR